MNDQTNSYGHYVPKFILRYFREGEIVHRYDREKNCYDSKSPKRIGGEREYYVFTDKEGNKNDAIERMFQQIETNAANIIYDLHNGKVSITEQEKADLGMFLAAQYTRVPDFFKKSEKITVEGSKEIMKRKILMNPNYDESFGRFEQKTGIKLSDLEKESYKKMVVEKRYEVEVSKGYLLKHMVLLMQDFYIYMSQMEWFVFSAPKRKAYITSDNPVFTYNPRPEGFSGGGIGLFAENCETTAILTPRIMIYLSQKHNPSGVLFNESQSNFVDVINRRVAVCSLRYVFSHSEALLKRWTERIRLSELPPYSQIAVG